MNKFSIPIRTEEFKATNSSWNQLMLNTPWSVGFVSHLIELKQFNSKEEWENFYFEMGAYRLKQLEKLDAKTKASLEDEQLIRTQNHLIKKLPKSIVEINTLNGRTEADLWRKGEILHKHLQNSAMPISIESCFKAVKYRVIGETWNGIILREHHTIKTLKQLFPTINFIKTEGNFDFKYAVDYELFNNNKLICGIQIKPKSDTYNTPYLKKAQYANREKNGKYFQQFNVPVFDIIATSNGKILNSEATNKIQQLLK